MSVGFLTETCREGNINTLLGVPRAGKSNFAVLLMYYLFICGWEVHTIIQFFKKESIPRAIELDKLLPENLLASNKTYSKIAPQLNTPKFEKYLPNGHYLERPSGITVNTCLSSMLKACLKPGKHVVFIDEGGILAESTAHATVKVRTMKKIAIMIGHLNACLWLLSQSDAFISPVFRDDIITYQMSMETQLDDSEKVLDRYLIIRKKSKIRDESNREVVDFPEVGRFHNILPSPLPYDNKFFARFVIDLDIDEAYQRFGEYDSVEIMNYAEYIVDELVRDYKPKKKRR
jgi:hypothetical protein